jgi:hypothetical protein
MRKVLFTLNINDYAPELRKVSYPFMRYYAWKIGAEFIEITERKYPDWPIVYEKLQIYERGRGYDWIEYLDADALVHPDTPDWKAFIPPHTVAHYGFDLAPIRWRIDEYFLRDGRMIGSPNWLAIAPGSCLDLWHPLEDLTLEEAVQRIYLITNEHNLHFKREHLIDDFTLSRNIARYGLKAVGLLGLMKTYNLEAIGRNYYMHQYDHETIAEKLAVMFKVVMGAETFYRQKNTWKILTPEERKQELELFPGWKVPKSMLEEALS